MKIRHLAAALALALLGQAAPAARADVVTFEGHPLDFEVVQVEGGFRFTTVADGWAIAPDDLAFNPPLVRNGTTRYLADGDRDGLTAQVDVARLDGLPFSLEGFDAATAFADFAVGQIEVIGFLDGGGTVNALIDVTNAFATYDLPGIFAGLIGFRVRETASGSFGTTPGFSLDNIRFSTSVVPEPASVALLAAGAPALLVVARRRRRARAGA